MSNFKIIAENFTFPNLHKISNFFYYIWSVGDTGRVACEGARTKVEEARRWGAKIAEVTRAKAVSSRSVVVRRSLSLDR